MVEAVCSLELVELLEVGANPLLEWVQLLHLVGPGGVGLGVVEHWLLVVHQGQEPGIEVWSRAWSPTQPALVHIFELRLPP